MDAYHTEELFYINWFSNKPICMHWMIQYWPGLWSCSQLHRSSVSLVRQIWLCTVCLTAEVVDWLSTQHRSELVRTHRHWQEHSLLYAVLQKCVYYTSLCLPVYPVVIVSSPSLLLLNKQKTTTESDGSQFACQLCYKQIMLRQLKRESQYYSNTCDV